MHRRSLSAIAYLATVALLAVAAAARADAIPPGALARVDEIAREGIDKKKVASYAVAVVKDGRLVVARGYGRSDLENDVPATAETVYRLGSITKQFTSMAIMQLAEQGKLSVDDELTKFLPDYPTQGHKVTIHHLLNHTSGIKSYTSLPGFFLRARNDLSHNELLALFKDEPFDFEPGAKWQYNNSGFYLLGMIVEKASGQNYGDYLAEHIFQPLGMTATRYGHTRPLIPRRAQGYKLSLGELVNDDPLSMTAPGAAGALVSNVLDLVKWHQALEAGALLSSASYEAMYRATVLADGKTQAYGYGWGLGDLEGRRKISHGGGINGFSTMIARYPDDRLAVIVLSNTAGAPAGNVERGIAKAMLGIEEKPVADGQADEKLLQALAGTYQLMDTKVEITLEDGKLYAQPNGQPRDRLKYQSDQTFVSSTNEEIRIRFRVKDGKAEGFDVQMQGQNMSATRVD
ncbi:MAG: serine hydrolase [Planctomycetia bacterium]|nr:serine hydrolase [Planctomycetia bacterium]